MVNTRSSRNKKQEETMATISNEPLVKNKSLEDLFNKKMII